MEDEILDYLYTVGPRTVNQVADALQSDVYAVAVVAVDLIDKGEIHIESSDKTLWYAGSHDE